MHNFFVSLGNIYPESHQNTKYMKLLTLVCSLLFLCCAINQASASGNQKAVVIGIDTYNPNGSAGRWMNLDGCANDALSVGQLLMARYGFQNENIKTLLNSEATRENILLAFNDLLSRCETGDVAVVYYAGHGSQVRNSLSEEKDLKDETMVPADSYLGAKDIRDKELALLFNKFADKGVLLTVLYDCCHSGSIGRGLAGINPPKLRHIPEDPAVDAKDPSFTVPPESRGVLIMSASQDFEYASEQIDDNGTPHGAFTIALLQSLSTLPVNASASEIFSSARAILKYNGKTQEPVLAATEERKASTIFGIPRGSLSGKTTAAVLDVSAGKVVLQGGFTIGIYPESILSCTKGDEFIRLKVNTIDAINKCTAGIIQGDIEKIRPGDLFELENWRLPEGSLLKVYITPSPYSYEQIVAIAKNLNSIGEKNNVVMVADPVADVPSHTVFFSDGSWFMGLPDNAIVNLGAKPDSKTILKNLPEGSKLYISLPPTRELGSALTSRYSEANAVEAVDVSSKAQYFLTGRMGSEGLEYAFFIPQVSIKDPSFGNAMPLRTNYFKISENSSSISTAADSLSDFSLRIAKIKAWLTLSPPPDDGSFPFNLRVKNATTDKFVSGDDPVKVGDILGFYLEVDKEDFGQWDKSKRYIYVFSIDSKGKMDLWFPLSGSVENRGPWFDAQTNIIQLSPLGRPKLLRVTEPCGIDTYIMLATNEPIPNPDVLNQPGVLTRGAASGFGQLLNIGAGTRGDLITPSEWGIQKVIVKSVPK